MRIAIDNFFADKRRYPATLDELVPNYLRRIPTDPITNETTSWIVEPSGPEVTDVHSGAPGKTCNGVSYSDL